MTIAKATHFQEELRQLFQKYGITSGFAMFMHDSTLHPVEAHVKERNPLIVQMMDGLANAARTSSDIPVWEHWSQDDN